MQQRLFNSITKRRALAAASLTALLAACGVHGNAIVPAAPRAPGGHPSGTQATVVVKIPARASAQRHAQYISPSTQSVSFAYSIGATKYPAQTLDVTPGSPGCSKDGNGDTVCTLTFGTAPGSAAYAVTAYDSTGGKGTALATAQSTMTIAAGTDNKFAITLDGVAASLQLGLTGADATGAIPAGTKTAVGLTISAYDADGNLIVNSPALLSASGSTLGTATLSLAPDSGEFTVSQNGTPLTASAGGYQLSAPFTGVSISYNGGRMTDVALTLGLGSLSAQTSLHVEPVLTLYTVQGTDPGLEDLTSGSDGNVWFTDSSQNSVGRITPSGNIIEYPVQTDNAGPDRITTDASGTMWFTETGNGCACIAKLSTDGTIAATFPAYHVSCQPYPEAIGVDANEDVWYTNAACNSIGYIQTNNGQGFSFGGNTDDTNMVVSPDGRAWTLGYDSSSQTYRIISTDLNDAVTTYATQINGPSALAVGTGNRLWFADDDNSGTSFIGYVDTSTNKIVNEYPIPAPPGGSWNPMPLVLTPDPDGSIWFAYDATQPAFGHLDPVSGKVTYLTLYGNPPALTRDTGHMIFGPDGNLWFVNYFNLNGGNDVIGKIDIGAGNL